MDAPRRVFPNFSTRRLDEIVGQIRDAGKGSRKAYSYTSTEARGEEWPKGTHSDGSHSARPFEVSSEKSKRYTVPVRKRNEEVRHLRKSRTPDLTRWAQQGVLLLNASLTVAAGQANAHVDFGWHEFTDAVIRIISREEKHVVFMRWGNYARQKKTLIDASKHLILESPHPSPLSAHKGFFGNGHFKAANAYLEKHDRGAINWC